MAALLIAWGVFILAVIARAILDNTRPPLATREDQADAEEHARMMEAIALSVF